MKKTILLTNDDGYSAAGLLSLYDELVKEFDVCVVAPNKEQSWAGKSITRIPVKTAKIEIERVNGIKCEATPATCTQIGLYELFSESKPDLVVSGINTGSNTGLGRALSSGTVGAAMEASLAGIPSVACSMFFPFEQVRNNKDSLETDTEHYQIAAKRCAELISKLVNYNYPEHTDLISINIPYKSRSDTPVRVTPIDRSHYGKLFNHHKESGHYINDGANPEDESPVAGSDSAVIAKGEISITPISLELVSQAGRDALKSFLDLM